MAKNDKSTFFEILQERNSLKGIKRSRNHRPSMPCQYEECNGWAWAQGFCGSHYHKMRREGLLPVKRIHNDPFRRYYSKIEVNPVSLCWEWQGFIHPSGYAIMGIGGNGRGLKVHRFAYQLFYGEIPPKMQVMHACDNRRCSNPAHISLGTAKENRQDAARKGRLPSKCKHLTPQMIASLRVLYAQGNHSISELAWIYGIDQDTARDIVRGRTHLEV
ncbi:HNH endonuclease signature motif containing protein [Zavarzinella formosa]|uniref:HNH endonuclease signature motif containing protein n=1 Tax=Zavarzinella formosa TaxID=360055 RepID=UPI00037C5F58|nr:HNH endonuclease signature motif containing protein [Zavarzinella formosa]